MARVSGRVRRTKFSQVKECLRDEILSGRFAPGDRFYSDNSLCEVHGISHVTASKVISALMHEGLVTRVRGSGTYVSEGAGGVPSLEGRTIGLVAFLETSHPEVAYCRASQVLCSVDGRTQELACRHRLFNLYPERAVGERVLSDLRSSELAGILVVPARQQGGVADLKKLLSLDVPVVAAGFGTGLCDCTVFDERQVGATATKHLLELGHRRIAFIHLEGRNYWNPPRIAAFEAAVAGVDGAHGGVFGMDEALQKDTAAIPLHIMPVLRQILDQECTAIVCSGDVIASAVMQAAPVFGVDIPRDLSLVGIDDMPSLRYLDLTSVRMSSDLLGVESLNLLAERILGRLPDEPQRRSLDCRLMRRSTAAPLPGAENLDATA